MSVKGGNTEISHAGDGRRKRAEILQNYWPGWFKIKEDGRVAPSRIWRTFTQQPSNELKSEIRFD